MRITGGAWRSRRLTGPPRGMPLRPTPDALRERAFAVLARRIEGARFLDLYAGTGAVGLEALSRGAAVAVFVEGHRAAAAIVRRNRDSLEVSRERARVLVMDAAAAVRRLARQGERFAIAWADPPFERWEDGLRVLETAAALGLLAAGAVACLECPARARPESSRLRLERELAGGASRLLIFRVDPESAP